VVEPRRLGDYGSVRTSDSFLRKPDQIEKDYQRRCDEIAEQIKRHVDNVDSVEVEYDEEFTCSHCGQEWQVDGIGCPICCDKAEQEFLAAKAEKVNS
jgi:Mg-chelatase subunit ChlI